MIPATQLVRDTCSFVVKNATHVSIDQEATKNLARKFVDDIKNVLLVYAFNSPLFPFFAFPGNDPLRPGTMEL